VPTVDAKMMVTGGEVMVRAVNDAPGPARMVVVPTPYTATIEEICASPTDAIGLIPASGCGLANDVAGVDVSQPAARARVL